VVETFLKQRFAMAAPASAVVFFTDDFNRANSQIVGNGWGESESENGGVRVYTNTLRVRDQNPTTGMAWHIVSTAGYQNITLSFSPLTPFSPHLALFGLGLIGLGYARRRKVA